MKKLWLLVGTPGIGKSTWIENHKDFFPGSVNIISRDKIRFSMLKEGEDYFSHETAVWNKFVKDSANAILSVDNTVIDATHLNEASRAKILRALESSLKDVEINAIYFKGSVKTAIARNEKREGLAYVPISAIRRMAASVTEPYFEEGFKKIYIIDVDNKDKITIKEQA